MVSAYILNMIRTAIAMLPVKSTALNRIAAYCDPTSVNWNDPGMYVFMAQLGKKLLIMIHEERFLTFNEVIFDDDALTCGAVAVTENEYRELKAICQEAMAWGSQHTEADLLNENNRKILDALRSTCFYVLPGEPCEIKVVTLERDNLPYGMHARIIYTPNARLEVHYGSKHEDEPAEACVANNVLDWFFSHRIYGTAVLPVTKWKE